MTKTKGNPLGNPVLPMANIPFITVAVPRIIPRQE